MARYVPDKGDFIAVAFDPQAGHEQAGRRPALVVTDARFNKRIGLAFCCPITNTDRRSPFHIPIPDESSVTGFIMTEQLKSLDYMKRNAKFIQKASQDTVDNVLAILDAVLFDAR